MCGTIGMSPAYRRLPVANSREARSTQKVLSAGAGWQYEVALRIHELTLATREPARQAMFWGETLGLPVRDAGDAAIEVSLQASTLRFEQAAAGSDPRYHYAINVSRRSIEEAAAWIEERHELLAFHGDSDEEEGATITHTDRGAAMKPRLAGAFLKDARDAFVDFAYRFGQIRHHWGSPSTAEEARCSRSATASARREVAAVSS
jgi:hypothetical protein